jgi:hypothetical protein
MRERRRNFRIEWNSPGKIYDCEGHSAQSCTVSNFSNRGARIVGVEPDTVPDEFILRILPRSRAHAFTQNNYGCRVVWRSKDSLGVEFTEEPVRASKLMPARRKRRHATVEANME